MPIQFQYKRVAQGVNMWKLSPGARSFPATRMRRMRRDEFSRRLMRESKLGVDDLVYPLFVAPPGRSREAVSAMPGVARVGLHALVEEAKQLAALRIPAVALFPVVPQANKSEDACEAWERYMTIAATDSLFELQ